jgi:menaquinone-dependent protoporphyrinogen oxidase
MRILVTVASKHQSTLEIGRAIGRALSSAGMLADVQPAEEVDTLTGYDAVVVGSGIYAGNWLGPARDFVERCAGQLRERPVWLFSSGPMGDPPVPAGDPAGVKALIDLIHPQGHRVFAGRLESGDLGFGEKLIVKAVRAPFGDFRDWAAIEAWARDIATELGVGDAAGAAPTAATSAEDRTAEVATA